MGLVATSCTQRHFILATLVKYNSVLCLLLYPLGIAAFVCLASPEINKQTYFSDNSLLPGMVERNTRIAPDAEALLSSLEAEVKSHTSIPYAWLAGQFRQAGLEVYRHNFTLSYPLGSRQQHTGENVYAILRAARASRTEAIVISAPFRPPTSPHPSNLASLATMIALAKQFRRKIYWSKDIIFVVTEHELLGLQAWLDAYHMVETAPGILLPGHLDARSGNILAAINLELQAKHIDQVNVKIFGLNGQLPNLDLVNTCKNLMLREAVPYILEDRADPAEDEHDIVWQKSAINLLSQMAKQATGVASGGHGLCHRFAIQSLTLQGQPKVRGYPHVSLTNIGRVIEGLVRSVNNLLQRFHRSFFYYYLPSMDRYVSIAYYMAAFGVLVSPVAVKSIALLLELHDQHPSSYMHLLWRSLPLLLISQLMGVLLFAVPVDGERLLKRLLAFSTPNALYGFVLGAMLQLLLLPLVTRRAIDPHTQRLVMLLHYLLVVGPLAMLNISLAVFVAVATVPVVLTAGLNTMLPLKLLQRLLQIVVNPFVTTFLVLLAHSVAMDKWHQRDDFSNYAAQAFSAHKKLLLFTVEDWYVYGNANFPILCLGFIPVWVHMWSL